MCVWGGGVGQIRKIKNNNTIQSSLNTTVTWNLNNPSTWIQRKKSCQIGSNNKIQLYAASEKHRCKKHKLKKNHTRLSKRSYCKSDLESFGRVYSAYTSGNRPSLRVRHELKEAEAMEGCCLQGLLLMACSASFFHKSSHLPRVVIAFPHNH